MSDLDFHFVGGVHQNDDGTWRFDMTFTGFKTKNAASTIGRWAHGVLTKAMAAIPHVDYSRETQTKN